MDSAMNPITYWVHGLGMALLGSMGESSNVSPFFPFRFTTLGKERETASQDQGQGPE
jgi:hypothetical protein